MDINERMETIAERIKKLRIEHGYSIETVAEAIHCSVENVRELEAGKGTQDAILIRYLAELYLVSIDYILCLSDDKTPTWLLNMMETLTNDELIELRDEAKKLLDKKKEEKK